MQEHQDATPVTACGEVELQRRGQWLFGSVCSQGWEPEAGHLAKARAKGSRRPTPSRQSTWRPIGPANIGGRATCLAVSPDDPDHVYLGSAGGGVWFSRDRGRHWRSIWPDDFEQNIGSLAIDPQHPEVIYCGTGEANGSPDSYPGTGVYRSIDSGQTWRRIASPLRHGVSTRIGCIAIDPFDSRHIWLAGFAKTEGEPAMLVSTNRGRSWNKAPFNHSGDTCHCILFHPRKPGVMFAAIQSSRRARKKRSGIWCSTDGGKRWRHLAKHLIDPQLCRRVSLAICSSQPDTMYAVASTFVDPHDRVLGVYRSDCGGEHWRRTSSDKFRGERLMYYANCIAVHPENPEFVLFGGTDLHLSEDGGKNWKRVTRWNLKRGDSSYAHADHHAIVIPRNTNGRIYDANDGGLDTSKDGRTWVNRSRGLPITMFYDVDVAWTNSNHYGGGTQDNGTVVTKTGRADDFEEILGADGGWMVYDPMDCYRIVASEQQMRLYRFRNAIRRRSILTGAGEDETASVWMSFIALDSNEPRIAYAGSTRVWKTTNGGFSWQPCSRPLDGSAISAIDVAVDSKRIYVGTENGGFFRSNGGKSWSRNLGRGQLPEHEITRIESHPTNRDLVFITIGQDEGSERVSHVWRSEDGGVTWEDADRGQLPNIKHTALAFRTDKPDYLYVANHVGVFATRNLGKTWVNITANLPNAMPVDLVYHERSKSLTVATYGRSLWRLQLR